MGNRVIAAKLLKEKRRKRKLPRYLRMDVVKTSSFNPHAPGAEVFRRKFDAPDSHTFLRDVSNTIAYDAMGVTESGEIVRHNVFEDGQPHEYNSVAHARAWLAKKPTTVRPALDNAKGSVHTHLKQHEKKDKTFAGPEWYAPSTSVDLIKGKGVVETLQESLDGESYNIQSSEEDVLIREWRSWKSQGNTYFVRMNVVDRRDLQLDMWFYGKRVYFIAIHPIEKLAKRSMNYVTIRRAKLELDHNNIRWVETIPIESA